MTVHYHVKSSEPQSWQRVLKAWRTGWYQKMVEQRRVNITNMEDGSPDKSSHRVGIMCQRTHDDTSHIQGTQSGKKYIDFEQKISDLFMSRSVRPQEKWWDKVDYNLNIWLTNLLINDDENLCKENEGPKLSHEDCQRGWSSIKYLLQFRPSSKRAKWTGISDLTNLTNLIPNTKETKLLDIKKFVYQSHMKLS